MIYDWFKLFSLPEFLATGLISRQLLVHLEGVGVVTILVSLGNTVSLYYEDAFLPVNFLGNNPYSQGQYAVYLDENDDVWFGIEVTE